MSLTPFERQTRSIFHELHTQQGDNDAIFQRLSTLLSPAYLREADDFFQGKICLDAGCGSNANATYSMLRQGAEKVYAFDLNDTIFETVQCLTRYPAMTNFRRFLSPLYERYDSSFARLLYGSGAVQLKAVKVR